MNYDYDYLIVGSGFGGSVSAMRLSQKGYSVVVIESGKKYTPETFPKRNWNLRKFLWMPKLGLYGIQRLNLLSDVVILSGAGVGGGSLVYANTLYIPPKPFFKNDIIKKLGGEKSLLPIYKLAQKMLGVVTNPKLYESDYILRDVAKEYGREDTFTATPVGVFFDDNEKFKNKDPFFANEGPVREGCTYCGGCMVGCRYNAKNTLDKNYLYFAEKFGAEIIPEYKVTEILPLSKRGEDGYKITAKKVTGIIPHKKIFYVKNLVLSAGVLGTLSLLFKMKQKKKLPYISDMLGKSVRTNSEAILGAKTVKSDVDFSKGVAITSSVYPDEVTHVEPVRYSKGSDAMGLLTTIMVDGGGKIPRQIKLIGTIFRHPIIFLRTLRAKGFSDKGIILLVMQTIDNSINVFRKRRAVWPFMKTLTSKNDSGKKNPSYIPIANDFARKVAKKIDGFAMGSINEVLLDIPTTAHILGGCLIGDSPETGVIDKQNKVFGYENMTISDASVIPANLGVNPSLSITTFAERAMTFVPPKDGKRSNIKNLKVEKKWKVTGLLNPAKKATVSTRKKSTSITKKKTTSKRTSSKK